MVDRVMEEYFYDWGGMKLEPGDWQIDNGPLFVAVYYALLASANKLSVDDQLRWLDMMRNIKVKKGIYTRYPGSQLVEAHDNYVGHILAAKVFDVSEVCSDINSVKNYNYNDIPPHEFRWETQRQGGDIALYNLADGKNPWWPLVLWLSIGIAIASVHNLIWCRVEILRLLWPDLSQKERFILRPGIKIWFKKMEHAYHDGTIITHYYNDQDHPNCQLAREIDLWHGEWWLR